MEYAIDPPTRLSGRVQGHTAYRAVFGGLFWTFFVSNHSEMLPDDTFLTRNGRLPVFRFELPALEFMSEFERHLSTLDTSDEPR